MSWRRRVRSTVDRLAWLSGVLRYFEQSMHEGVTILTYHRVLDGSACDACPLPSLAMPVEDFETQMRWLADRYELTTVGEAMAAGTQTRRPTVCLTFDDGYVDAIETVAPILESHEARGTFFVTTAPVTTHQRLWFDRAALLFSCSTTQTRHRVTGVTDAADPGQWLTMLKGLDSAERDRILDRIAESSPPLGPLDAADRHLSAEAIANLADRGHEVASHSHTHPILTSLDDTLLADEIERSRETLRSISGQPVAGFCYPNGDHDDRVVAAVAKAGHLYGCTTRSGRNLPGEDPFRLRRVDVTLGAVSGVNGCHDTLAFRAEVSRMHELWR